MAEAMQEPQTMLPGSAYIPGPSRSGHFGQPQFEGLEFPDEENVQQEHENLVPPDAEVVGPPTVKVTETVYQQWLPPNEAGQAPPGVNSVTFGSGTYGATENFKSANFGKAVEKTDDKLHPVVIIGAIFQPLIIYSIVFLVSCTEIRYRNYWPSTLFCLMIGAGIGFAFWRQPDDRSTCKGRLATFAFCSNLLAWSMGLFLGQATYDANFKPYFDLQNLAHYTGPVDSMFARGQQYSDAGQIDFLQGSRVDLTRSYGFKSGDMYCVAPIVPPETPDGAWFTAGKQHSFDFWAVGTNCCSGHAPDFHCGEYQNAFASKGLRLTRDDLRDYYRLAVEGAVANYNIEARSPIFVYFMADPKGEMESYKNDGWAEFVHGFFSFCFFQTLATGIAGFFWINGSAFDKA